MVKRSTYGVGVLLSGLSLLVLSGTGCGDDWPGLTGAAGAGGAGGGVAGAGGTTETDGGGGGGIAGTEGGAGGSGGGAGDEGSAAGSGGSAGTGGVAGSGGGAGIGGASAGTGGGNAGTGGASAGTGGGSAGIGGASAGTGGASAGTGGGNAGTGGASAGTGGGNAGTGGSNAGTGGGNAGTGGGNAGTGGGNAGTGGGNAGTGGGNAGTGGGNAGIGGTGGCQVATDCSSGQVCDGTTHSCGPCGDDNACQSGYGANHVCVNGGCVTGNCHTFADCSDNKICNNNSCVPCADDGACLATYGPGHLCISGGCVPGQCKTKANCPIGELCTASYACTGCATDAECISGYGANHLCVNGACIAGDCRSTADCLGRRICDTAAYTCVACADDASCVTAYGNGHLCVGGSCIDGNCRSASQCAVGEVCDGNNYMCRGCTLDGECQASYGLGTLCEAGACVPGECRTSPECPSGKLCDSSHFCGACATDAACVAGYGANHLCVGGACVSGTCHTNLDCGGGGQICDTNTFSCIPCANDAACVAAYGSQHLCIGNVCVTGECRASADCVGGHICDAPTRMCHPCAVDTSCSADPDYGASTVCVSGGCISGDCHGSSSDCPTGQLCGIALANTCGGCSTDAQCTSDTVYGTGNICYQGICQRGDCHGTSADCTGALGGLLCGASSANTCGPCATDAQCQTDQSYGSSTICNTTTGQTASGQCVSDQCSSSGPCAANTADFCCGGTCTAGNCCADADCAANPQFGPIYRCVNNSCTGCAGATGNRYTVDPIDGNDATATGSGIAGGVAAPSCSFKTLTRALQVVGSFAVPGTQIVVVGQSGMTVTLDGTETLPIVVPANVTIATTAGPIRLNLPPSGDSSFANVAGFQLGGDLAAIAPDPAAPLTIDGGSNLSGIAIGVSPGSGKSVSLTYVTVQSTGGHGISVSNGTLAIGPGVTVSGAGSAAKRRDGLNVAGGTVNITVGTGQAPSTFNNNTQHGIYVTGSAVVNVSGVPVTTPTPNGQGTVQANGNFFAGLRIFEAPGAAGMSSVDGLVTWGNAQNGLRLYGGAKVRVRNSVFLANVLDGVFITSYDATAAGNDLSQIDLGRAGAPGRNQIQALVGSNPDLAGLCIAMSGGMGTLSLAAEGNVFAGPSDCTISNAGIVRSSVCGGYVDLGVIPAVGTTVAVDLATCH